MKIYEIFIGNAKHFELPLDLRSSKSPMIAAFSGWGMEIFGTLTFSLSIIKCKDDFVATFGVKMSQLTGHSVASKYRVGHLNTGSSPSVVFNSDCSFWATFPPKKSIHHPELFINK